MWVGYLNAGQRLDGIDPLRKGNWRRWTNCLNVRAVLKHALERGPGVR